jgi:tetratricopeptide (TPR) repeat protein
LNNLSVLLGKKGDRDAAEQARREALSILREHGNAITIASTYNNIGMSLEERGDHETAIQRYKDAIAIQEELGDVGELMIFLGNLAHACRALDRRADAIDALRRNLALAERVDATREGAIAMHALANELARDGVTPEADACYARSVEAFTALGDLSDLAWVEMARARAWSRAGDHVKALALGEHALSLRLELGDGVHIAAALDNLGLIHSEAGNHDKAIELMERSLALAEKVGDHEGIPIVLSNLASEYAELDLHVKAVECYGRALSLEEAADDREALAWVLDELGRLHYRLAEDGPAITYSRLVNGSLIPARVDGRVDRRRRRSVEFVAVVA